MLAAKISTRATEATTKPSSKVSCWEVAAKINTRIARATMIGTRATTIAEKIGTRAAEATTKEIESAEEKGPYIDTTERPSTYQSQKTLETLITAKPENPHQTRKQRSPPNTSGSNRV